MPYPLKHPCGLETSRRFNRVCAWTGLTWPYDAPRDRGHRASLRWATNCALDAERRLACASCGPHLPLTTLYGSIFGDVVLGVLQTLARAAGPPTVHPT